MKRIGVFVCHCGTNIASKVDVRSLVESARELQDVAYAADYQFMCSEPGQKLLVNSIREHDLNRVVIASCTPRLHEETFRKAVKAAGLNPYLLEIANIREQCAWVHDDREEATRKASELVSMAVAKARNSSALDSTRIPITKSLLVIGAGIAGIQTALDVADNGYDVMLLDREPTIGGNMVKLDKTFPTLDCSA